MVLFWSAWISRCPCGFNRCQLVLPEGVEGALQASMEARWGQGALLGLNTCVRILFLPTAWYLPERIVLGPGEKESPSPGHLISAGLQIESSCWFYWVCSIQKVLYPNTLIIFLIALVIQNYIYLLFWFFYYLSLTVEYSSVRQRLLLLFF